MNVLKIIFENIEKLYTDYRELLIDSEGLRPSKSTPRDIFGAINKFKNYYTVNKCMSVSKQIIAKEILEVPVDTDTFSTNIRIMKEFEFIIGPESDQFKFTAKFIEFIDSDIEIEEYFCEKLKSINCINDFKMVFNAVLCTLREGYLFGRITKFPDSKDKFEKALPNSIERIKCCKMVKEIYGFEGRGKDANKANYSPNANYRLITTLLKLEVIELGSITTPFTTYELTEKGLLLLKDIDASIGRFIYNNELEEEDEDMKPQQREEKVPQKVSHEIKGINKMYFGAPGTGKSFSIKNFIYDEFKKDPTYKTEYWENKLMDDKRDNPNVFRTTLHPEFTYNDFVGQLQPKKNGKSITYDFVPKIFTQALTAAIRHPKAPIFLILEELSRANVAAVFGDIFQLLDRSTDGSSEYSIDNDCILQGIEDIYQSYVVEGTEDDRQVYEGYEDRGKKIFIPNNLFIIGTVNTSDQNVFVMDTAFKRRFEFDYMDANQLVYDEYDDEEKIKGKKGREKNNFKIKLARFSDKVEELNTNWIELYTNLNSFITAKEDKGLGLSEDKQLGQFFLKFKEDTQENEEFNNAQLYGKLLQYLWEDIKLVSYSDKQLFDIELDTFSQAYRRMKNGENVFHQDFMKYLH